MQKKKMNNLFLMIFSVCIINVGNGQNLAKAYVLESMVIKNKSCYFEAKDYSIVFKFKRRNKLNIIDNSPSKITDLRILYYSIEGDSLSFGWSQSHMDNGHKLYQFCYQDFKRALNSKYKIVINKHEVILENNLYKFVLKKREKESKKLKQ